MFYGIDKSCLPFEQVINGPTTPWQQQKNFLPVYFQKGNTKWLVHNTFH